MIHAGQGTVYMQLVHYDNDLVHYDNDANIIGCHTLVESPIWLIDCCDFFDLGSIIRSQIILICYL